MARRNVLYGCQLRIKGICVGDSYIGKFNKHHLIPLAWQRKHPDTTKDKIKGVRHLMLMLDPNCHTWIHDEMRRRGLNSDSSEEEMYKFVDSILSRKYY